MAAYTDRQATQAFADLLTAMAEGEEAELQVDDGTEHGYLVPVGETLVVHNYETDETYLVTVQKVD